MDRLLQSDCACSRLSGSACYLCCNHELCRDGLELNTECTAAFLVCGVPRGVNSARPGSASRVPPPMCASTCHVPTAAAACAASITAPWPTCRCSCCRPWRWCCQRPWPKRRCAHLNLPSALAAHRKALNCAVVITIICKPFAARLRGGVFILKPYVTS